MPRKLRLPRKKHHQLALFLLTLFIIATVIYVVRPRQSTLTVTSKGNSFKLNFQIERKDEPKFSKFIANMDFPQSVQKGVQFQLDSTSSAKFNYAQPIEAKLSPGENYLNFQGTFKRSFKGTSFTYESIKIPEGTSFAVLTRDLGDFLTKNFNPPDDFTSWAREFVKSPNGIYIVIFGPNNDFVIAFKNKDFNIDPLRKMKDSNGNPVYKEETSQNSYFGFLNLQQMSLTISRSGDWNFIASQNQAAHDFVESFSQKSGGQVFPSIDKAGKISFALYFQNQNPQSASTVGHYFFGSDKFSKVLEKLSLIALNLNEDSFSGSISVK